MSDHLLGHLEVVRECLQLGLPCIQAQTLLRDALDESIADDARETAELVRGWTDEIFQPSESPHAK